LVVSVWWLVESNESAESKEPANRDLGSPLSPRWCGRGIEPALSEVEWGEGLPHY
jgi:hypothetical protein